MYATVRFGEHLSKAGVYLRSGMLAARVWASVVIES
jgi:hypothetical protein